MDKRRRVRFPQRCAFARAAPVAALSLIPTRALADEEVERRPPLAEPIFTETVTDIDGYETGEVELSVNGAEAVARRGGARVYQTSAEVEWKVWSRLGLRLEPSVTSSLQEHETSSEKKFGFRTALGWNLIHDFVDDFHLQVEAGGRVIDDSPDSFKTQAGEAPLPFNADLKAAKRISAWTLRGSVGTEAGGTAVHAPLRLQLAAMCPITDDIRFGFLGIEADADFARQTPLILAPNVWADVTPIGIPGRIGFGVPLVIGAPDAFPAAGVYVRLLILTSREASFERNDGQQTPIE
jgi:hypothetical protein